MRANFSKLCHRDRLFPRVALSRDGTGGDFAQEVEEDRLALAQKQRGLLVRLESVAAENVELQSQLETQVRSFDQHRNDRKEVHGVAELMVLKLIFSTGQSPCQPNADFVVKYWKSWMSKCRATMLAVAP